MTLAQRCEAWVLGKEPPPWVKGAALGLYGGLDDPLCGKVALARPGWTENDRLTTTQVWSITVGLRHTEDGCDAEDVAGSRDAGSNLAAVCDEKTPKSLHGRAP